MCGQPVRTPVALHGQVVGSADSLSAYQLGQVVISVGNGVLRRCRPIDPPQRCRIVSCEANAHIHPASLQEYFYCREGKEGNSGWEMW